VIQSPVINTVPGAMPIQEVIEHTEWVSQAGNPVAYAPHVRKAPLAGVPAKSVIFQFAKGDPVVPNPAATALLRAGDLADRATFYRHDLAFAENPQLPTIPHGFLTRLDIPGFRAITRGAQEQIATFFATDGATVIHPEPARFFEMPIAGPLPENLNFISGPLPKTLLTINNVTVTASDTGTVTAVFTVSLSGLSSRPVTVNYATADGTATAGGNGYVLIFGTLTFARGEGERPENQNIAVAASRGCAVCGGVIDRHGPAAEAREAHGENSRHGAGVARRHRHIVDRQQRFRQRPADEVEIFRQRPGNWHLEEPRRLRVDDGRAVRGEERRDLLLGAPGDRPKTGDVKSGQEPMRNCRQLGVLREGEVVAVERGAVGQVARAQQRGGRRVRNDLVSLGELED